MGLGNPIDSIGARGMNELSLGLPRIYQYDLPIFE